MMYWVVGQWRESLPARQLPSLALKNREIMVSVIFIVGVLNFALGYGLFVYLQRRQAFGELSIVTGAADVATDLPVSEASGATEEEVKELPPVDEEIPEEWLDILEEVEFSGTFVEASVQVLRLEVGRYRGELIATDDRVRACQENPDPEVLAEVLADLKKTNEAWLTMQGEAADHLSDRKGKLEAFAEMGNRLEDILLDQQAQIETTCSNIETMDFTTDIESGCKRLVGEICKLMDMAHILRDRMHESLIAIMAGEGKLETVDAKLRLDGLTGLSNRTGLESVLAQWDRDDPSRIRQISLAVIDIDRFARINEQYGAVAGDRLLSAFADLVDNAIRKNRGNDFIARVASEQFIAHLGDTGPRNATSLVERIRCVVDESTFELDEHEIELTVSCGVTEVLGKEEIATVFKRLNKALREARKGGRNQTWLDEGNGPEHVTPPEFKFKGKTVRVP